MIRHSHCRQARHERARPPLRRLAACVGLSIACIALSDDRLLAEEIAFSIDIGSDTEMSDHVDGDDPRTGSIDESSGLDPSALYASFMDGTCFTLAGGPSTMYAIELNGDVREVDPSTGAATLLGNIGEYANAMAADSAGRIFTMYFADEMHETSMAGGTPTVNC
jgi:hypothetical protein